LFFLSCFQLKLGEILKNPVILECSKYDLTHILFIIPSPQLYFFIYVLTEGSFFKDMLCQDGHDPSDDEIFTF